MINWYTRWLNTPKALGGVASTRELLLDIRAQEQAGYGLLAPQLGDSAPVDDDFTYTFPAGALRSPAAAVKFGLDLENLMLGIGIGAASSTVDAGVAASIASVVGSDGMHIAALDALAGGQVIPDALPTAIGVDDASNQLSPFLSN
jgi:hypothetical protein